MKIKLTRKNIPALKAPQKGYSLFWDSELPNFGIRLTAGGARSYIVQRRIDGRDRRITLGGYEVLTPEQARNEARKKLGQIASGIDPIAERAKKRAATATLGEAFEAYLGARHNLKDLTRRDMRNAMEDLGWGMRQIATITSDHVLNKHAELGKRSHARANLTMRYLRAVLNFAANKYQDSRGESVLPANPVRHLSKQRSWYNVQGRRTTLKEHELKPWMGAVMKLKNTEARDYFMTVLLTGLRRTESMGLRWEDIDLKDRTLTIPDPKNREPFTLPLSDYLVDLFTARKEEAPGRFVFETARGRLHNVRYAMAEVETQADVTFCLHDLRRTFATAAERLDVPAYSLKALLNHKARDITGKYIQIEVERLRKPMQRITEYFLAAGGIRASAEVKELKARPKRA
jgi:integrase